MEWEDFEKCRTWCAIDVETANALRDSVCSIAMVRVEDRRIVTQAYALIKPPKIPGMPTFAFSYIHGLRWADVCDAPTFGEVWPALKRMMMGCEAMVAHNAGFDRSALERSARFAGLELPKPFDRHDAPWVCTMMLARRRWGLKPTRLPDVCRHLGLELEHHNAASDALACANIALKGLGITFR
jgi:DNA polymerase-3 subunit epsilon